MSRLQHFAEKPGCCFTVPLCAQHEVQRVAHIPVAQRIAAIPPHIQHDDFGQEVPPFEQRVSRHLEQG